MFGRSCSYTVCPINRKGNQICRIRYDFESFQIAGPETGITRSTATTIAAGDGGAIGDCIEDAFSISSPSGPGSPVICGTNSGYHSKCTVFENRPPKVAFNIASEASCIHILSGRTLILNAKNSHFWRLLKT